MRSRLPLLALLFTCLLALLPAFAAAQDNTDQFVDQIEAHFHFKNSITGDDLSHDALKTILLQRNGSTAQATFLNQGALICKALDVKATFGQQDYVSAMPLLLDFINIFVPTNFDGLADDYIGDVIEENFEEIDPFWRAWDALKTTIDLTLDFVQYLMDDSKRYIENVQLKYYLDNVHSLEGDDDFVWSTVQYHLPIVFSDSDKTKFHEICKTTWQENQSLAGLDGSVAVFRAAINKRIAGQAVVNVTPFGLYAPTTVTLDGSDSIGPNGTEAIGHHWIVDGNDLGVGVTKTIDYWAVGTHHVTLDVTSVDSHNNLFHLTTDIDFAVGAPPILIDSIDSDHFLVNLHTIKNAKVANYIWDFGDGTTFSGPDLDKVTHTYSDGTKQYSVYVKVQMVGYADVTSQAFQVAFHQNPTDWNGGIFQSDTDWGTSGSPYRIHGTLTIPKGVTLTLEPGVVLQFDGNAGLEVYGKVLSKGQTTATKRVYLVPAGDNSPPSLPQPGADNSNSNWQGVLAHAGAQVSVSSVTFRKAYTALWTNEGGLSSVSGATFENCNNSIYEYNPRAESVVFSGNTLIDSGVPSFQLSGGDLVIAGNSVPRVVIYGQIRSFSHADNHAPTGRCDLDLYSVTLTGDNAWTGDAGEKLRVQDSLLVAQGATLKLAPGSTVFFTVSITGLNDAYNGSPLRVRGSLQVDGEGTGPATLTESEDESPIGGQDQAHYQWQGVQVFYGGTARLSGLVIRHAYSGVTAPGSVSGGRFEACVFGTMPYGAGSLSVSACNFIDCTNALRPAGDIDENGNAINLAIPNDVSFFGNTLTNTSASIGMYGGSLTLTDNAAIRIAVSGLIRTFVHSGNQAPAGRCILSLESVTLTGDNAWAADAGEKLVARGPLTVEIGARLKLNQASALFFGYDGNLWSLLRVRGSLKVSGSGNGSGLVAMTAEGDETPIGGDDHGSTYNSIWSWQGIVAEPNASLDLSGLLIRHAYHGVDAESISADGLSFQLCGIALQTSRGSGVLRNCSFTGNGFAINNLGTVDVDARGCWFGDPSGPYNATNNPNGKGNPVSDHVLFGDVAATMTGTVTLQNYVASAVAGTTVTVELRLPGTTTSVESLTATLDANGNLSLAITSAPGTYDVAIKGSHWLRRVVHNVSVTASGASIGAVSLINGDVNGDNYVTAADRAKVTAALGTQVGDPGYNPLADLNGDGYVTAADRAIATANLGAQGDD